MTKSKKVSAASWWKPEAEVYALVSNLAARRAVSGKPVAVYEKILASLEASGAGK